MSNTHSSTKSSQNDIIKIKPPPATLVTKTELILLGLTPYSRDPSGNFIIVVEATELDNIYIYLMNKELQGNFVIAPEGYYWKYFSERNYFRFNWYELFPIPE